MRPHPRIRKTIKWGGLALLVIVALLWVTSLRLHATWAFAAGGYASLACGHCRLFAQTPSPFGDSRFHWYVSDVPPRPEWKHWILAEHDRFTLWFPLSTPFVIVAVPTALAWRLDFLATRRLKLGACPTCSYLRTGLAPSAPCPECGAAAPQA